MLFLCLFLHMAEIVFEPVEKFDLVKHELFHINNATAHIALAPDGRFAIYDSAADECILFSEDGQLLKRFGRKGQGPGEFEFVSHIQWLPAEAVWAIVDWGNSRVSKWTIQGDLVSETKTPLPSVGGSVHFFHQNTMVYSDFTFGVFGSNPKIIRFDLVEQKPRTIYEHKLLHTIPVIRLENGGVHLCLWNPALVFSANNRFMAVAFGTDDTVHLMDFEGSFIFKSIAPELKRYPITDEDIALQKANLQTTNPAAFKMGVVPPDSWPLITHIVVDPHDRIWIFGAKRFSQTYPVVIYTTSGEKFAQGELNYLPVAIQDTHLFYISWNEDDEPTFVKATYAIKQKL